MNHSRGRLWFQGRGNVTNYDFYYVFFEILLKRFFLIKKEEEANKRSKKLKRGGGKAFWGHASLYIEGRACRTKKTALHENGHNLSSGCQNHGTQDSPWSSLWDLHIYGISFMTLWCLFVSVTASLFGRYAYKRRLRRSYCLCMNYAWSYVSVTLPKKSMHVLLRNPMFLYDASTGWRRDSKG